MGAKEKVEIVAAWAAQESGPGWTNSPVWYIRKDRERGFVLEALQPEEQTAQMQVLAEASATIARQMRAFVEMAVNESTAARTRRAADLTWRGRQTGKGGGA